jgi:DNA-binding LacI/PurR family transcriptional regulator
VVGRRTTIAEIAAQAGASVSTVSKVLNGRPGVGDQQRDRILTLLAQAEYTRRGEPKPADLALIDLVMADLHGGWSARVLHGAEAEAHRAGFALVVSALHTPTLGERGWLDGFRARRSAGLIVAASRTRGGLARQLRRLRVPCVLLDPLSASPAEVATIATTNFAGSRDATQHLIDLGHRRIGLISGPADLPYSLERLDGYRAALAHADIAFDAGLVRYGAMDPESGHRLGGELLDLPDAPTAIFTGSDLHAHGLYRAAGQRQVSIPDRLSVVGFDNLDSGQWCAPPLTTVNQPLEDMGALAVRAVLAPGPADGGRATRVELATSLIIRESTAPPPTSRA